MSGNGEYVATGSRNGRIVVVMGQAGTVHAVIKVDYGLLLGCLCYVIPVYSNQETLGNTFTLPRKTYEYLLQLPHSSLSHYPAIHHGNWYHPHPIMSYAHSFPGFHITCLAKALLLPV